MNNNHSRLSPEETLDNHLEALNQGQPHDECREKEINDLLLIARTLKKGQHSAPEGAEGEGVTPEVERERIATEAVTPREEFVESLWQKLKEGTALPAVGSEKKKKPSLIFKKRLPWAGLAAALLILWFATGSWLQSEENILQAMEASVKQLQNYHGTLEKISTNEAGEQQTLIRTEIWCEDNKYATKTEQGLLSINNGELRWLSDPKAKELTLLPVYSDPHDFDLQKEAAKALRYPHEITGNEQIAGYETTRLKILPPGGLSYFLWIDQETHLPVRLQTAMQNSFQVTYTYTSLDINTTIPQTLFAYNPPSDYRIIDQNPDKLVSDLTEGIAISGFTPLRLSQTPQRLFASPRHLVFDFGDTVVIQSRADRPLTLNPLAALGQAAGGLLEILPDSLRWQQDGLEILIQGERLKELALELTGDLNLTPQTGSLSPEKPVIKVEPDMEVVKNNQQQVDRGSSPWQLDPLQVAYTFIALQTSPDGITGNPPFDFNSLTLTKNDGRTAVIQAAEGPVKAVYLERLIRQDETGIWTVTAYLQAE